MNLRNHDFGWIAPCFTVARVATKLAQQIQPSSLTYSIRPLLCFSSIPPVLKKNPSQYHLLCFMFKSEISLFAPSLFLIISSSFVIVLSLPRTDLVSTCSASCVTSTMNLHQDFPSLRPLGVKNLLSQSDRLSREHHLLPSRVDSGESRFSSRSHHLVEKDCRNVVRSCVRRAKKPDLPETGFAGILTRSMRIKSDVELIICEWRFFGHWISIVESQERY